MTKIFGMELTKRQLLERVGDVSQVAGIKRYRMEEGKRNSILAADMVNGSGLGITILPGRGMDIANAAYKGIPLAWISKCNLVSSSYYEEPGIGWLRNFFGGLLTTCGLTYAGAPCIDGGRELGLHGRISNTEADEVCCDSEWVNDDYIMKVSGKVKESVVFGENISLLRNISMKMGENRIYIDDTIENLGFDPQPFMVIYHMNFGFPLIDEGTKLYVTSDSITGATEKANKFIKDYDTMSGPVHGIEESVFYHKCYTDDAGLAYSLILNNNLKLGVLLRFNCNELPNVSEWKMMGQGDYVLGVEPCNCKTLGRALERQSGSLRFIQPFETRKIHIELDILDGDEEIKKGFAHFRK